MKKIACKVTTLLVIFLIAACNTDEIARRTDDNQFVNAKKFMVEALIAGEDTSGEETQTRVSLEKETNDIKLTWKPGDAISLCIVQGVKTPEKHVITLSEVNIFESGKKARFEFDLPEAFDTGEDATFTLYGVHGGRGLDNNNPTLALLPEDNSRMSLQEVEDNNDVMLYFSAEDISVADPANLSVKFNHLGSIYNITLVNKSDASLDISGGVELVSVANETGWAYSSGSFDLLNTTITSTLADHISFHVSSGTVPAKGVTTLYRWLPILPDNANWPELALELNSQRSDSKDAQSAEAGKNYMLTAAWDGIQLSLAPNPAGEKFTPTIEETARPGVGAYTAYDIIPIRGEYIESQADPTPIVFPSGATVGGPGTARKAFRMWFIIKKGVEFSGPNTFINLVDSEGYRLGTLVDEVENILGEGSRLGAGNPRVAGNIKNIQGHFDDDIDNVLYDIYYTAWDIGANPAIVHAPPGNYVVPFYIEPRIPPGNNTGADIPTENLYMECPVTITVVTNENPGGEEPEEGNTFTPADYAGCDTYTFTYTERNLNMRIDVPKNQSEKTPFIIYVTGGSWTGGSVGAFQNQSRYLATRGIAGIRVVYSYVKDGGNFQMGVDEMRAAYDFAASKADELNLDITRFGYVGGSAGCTIAAYAAMTIPGCDLYMGCNGLYDLLNLDEDKFPSRNSESMKYLEPYSESQLAGFSPIRVIPTMNIPAVALFHGTNDNTILHQRSVDFANAVETAGGRSEMYSYEGYGHGFFNAGAFEDVTLKMYAFARSIFGL